MRPIRHRQGISLLLVVSVVALAAVTGLAMLASGSLQAQAGRNSVSAVQATALAESGIELASYNLMYPWRAGVAGNGYWTGGNGISLGAGAGGNVDVTVTKVGTSGIATDYQVKSTGKATSSAAHAVTRTITATLRVCPGVRNEYAVILNGTPSIALNRSTIVGDVQAAGDLTLNASVTGTVYAVGNTVLGLLGSLLGGGLLKSQAFPAGTPALAPASANLSDYVTAYKYGLSTYSAKTMGSTISGGTYGTSSDNPAGIWVAPAGLTINGSGTTINGTLVVQGGALNISGTGIKINPQPGYPALVVLNDIWVKGTGAKTMTANGLVYTTGSVKSLGLVGGSALTVNGELLFGSAAGTVDSLFGGTVQVNNTRENLVDISLDKTAPAAVTVLSWSE